MRADPGSTVQSFQMIECLQCREYGWWVLRNQHQRQRAGRDRGKPPLGPGRKAQAALQCWFACMHRTGRQRDHFLRDPLAMLAGMAIRFLCCGRNCCSFCSDYSGAGRGSQADCAPERHIRQAPGIHHLGSPVLCVGQFQGGAACQDLPSPCFAGEPQAQPQKLSCNS